MNRRKFFGLAASTVAALGLPAIVLPERRIFLPPRGGWNTFQVYASTSLREDLIDAIYNVDPFKTPLFAQLTREQKLRQRDLDLILGEFEPLDLEA